MRFIDKVFGNLNDGQPHGVLAGFLPAIAPSLVAAGAVALGAPVGEALVVGAALVAGVAAGAVTAGAGVAVAAAVAAGVAVAAAGAAVVAFAAGAVGAVATGAVGAVATGAGAAFLAEKKGYNTKRYFSGAGAGLTLGAVLAFNVVAAHLPPEQPKARVDGPTPSTLHIESRGGSLCKDFKIADNEMTDKQGRKVYILAVPQDCSLAPNP